MRTVVGLPFCVGLIGSLIACGGQAPSDARSPSGPEWFADVTDRLGLTFVHETGPPTTYLMPYAVGSGGGFLDFDNDGRLDVLLLQNAPDARGRNRLFHQEANGTFRDVSTGSGLDVAGYGMGVAVGDIHNDGWPDVLLTEYGRLRLFANRRNGTFEDVTRSAGLDSVEWGTSASFLDYDRDGWLDLFVANYVLHSRKTCRTEDGAPEFCPPNRFEGGISRLYHNLGRSARGPAGTPRFEDVTTRAGLERKGSALGVVVADFTGDRWPDIFVANDGMANGLWINRHDGTFRDEALARGVAYDAAGVYQANMGIAAGDVHGDGMLDLFVSHITSELHNLWLQGPTGSFQDRTSAMGLAYPKWRSTGFGTVFGDFDQDGALDLALANGDVWAQQTGARTRPQGDFWAPYAQRNQLFGNDGTGRFADISERNPSFSEPAGVSRGLAIGDIDGDGALDLLVTRIAASARLFRNTAPNRGHWLAIRATLPESGGRDAYGAEVVVHAGSRAWKRVVNPGFSYLVSNAPDVHVGLGQVERTDAITVVWPDGTEEQFPGGAVDRALTLRKGAGRPGERPGGS